MSSDFQHLTDNSVIRVCTVMAQNTRESPWLFHFRSSETFVVVTVTIAIFTDAFIYGMHWLSEWAPVKKMYTERRYLSDLPFFGYIADQSRLRRLPFVFGLIALAASTALFAFATSFPALVLARGLQGLSGAAVWVVGLAIVSDGVPAERVGAAMGYTTIGLTWGFVLGPMMGGYIYEHMGWYGAFVVPTALIFLDVVLRFLMIETPSEYTTPLDEKNEPSNIFFLEKPHQSKPESHLHSGDGVNSYDTFNGDNIQRLGHTSLCQDHDSEGAPLLVSSRCADRGEKKATIFSLLVSPRMPVAMLATVIMATMFTALETTLPLYTMETFNWGSSGAGLVFLAVSLPTFGGVYIGKAIDKMGVRSVGTSGFAMGCLAWILMRFITSNTPGTVASLVILLLLMGSSIAAIEITAMTEVSQVIGDYEIENPGAFGDKSPVAQGYALFNMSFAGGQLIGPLVSGAIRVHAGWSTMTLVLGVMCAVAAIPFTLFSGPPQKKKQPEINSSV
ncbi:hypothetical protein N7493_006720 [Penicillium malachiteum]|uniref:Major facilitator superfamily (MFS) profile domain-containing protein n=1 Tax=Penicillium malachiteum TaxID=1324776 RepID=A0AAD6HJ69_9EURO|nr:hypothetical protein N7493_006720 [Penicillium malachiteum]